MASINSFHFGIETKIECMVLNHSSFGSHSLSNHRKNPVNCSGILTFMDLNSGKSYRRSSSCKQVSVNGRKREGLLRMKRVKAAASDSNEGEDVKETEDAIQATLEKSKKVLAMQKQLLQQIAERRRLVSSIKSSIFNPDDELVSSADDKSSSEVDLGTNTQVNVSQDYKSIIASRSKISPLPSNTSNDQSPVIQANSQKGKRQQVEVQSRTLNFEVSIPKEASTRLPEKARGQLEGSSNIGKTEPTGGKKQQVKAPSEIGSLASSTQKPLRTGVPRNDPAQYGESSGVRESETTESSSHENSANVMKSSRNTEGSITLADFLTKPNKSFGIEDQKVEASTSKEPSDQVVNPLVEDAKPPPLAGANVMNVILVAAECAHWVKTGGLGDVAGALPKALARRGHRVMVVVPRYGDYPEPQDTGVRKRYKVAGQDNEVGYYQTYIDGVDFVFIDAPMFRHLGNNIYGGNRLDILKRMVLFCKAAVEVPWHVPCGGVCYGDGNLVFIANDWHTALLPVYLKAYYRDNGIMMFTRSVLVIHNIAHQGRGPVDDFSYVDLPPHYIDYFRMYDPVGGEHFNIFAAGLKAADRIVTVSHGYAWEVKTLEGGWGLHGIINESDWKLTGIVNGIDTRDWNPQFDVHLKSDGYCNYSLETLKPGKAQCKAALQRELGLPVRADVPLLGFIGRLDHQKGVDLIAEAIPWLMGQDVQLVMLGSGRADLEQMLRQFESQYHDKIRGWVGFSVKTSHRITAGADILLMPSRFEPCGLNQLYAMSYGTIPVVHAVGGLRDTVQPFDPYNNTGVGWTFDRAEAERLIHALGNCLYTYRDYKDSWEGLQTRGMTKDLSWDHAAQLYEEVLVAAKYQW